MPDIPFDLLQGPYLCDLLDQPRAMAETVDRLSPQPQLKTLRRELRDGRYRRIVLTGMGSSHLILHPLHIHLTQTGFNSIMVETSELLHAMPRLLTRQSIVIAVSQSGASAETVRMLEHSGGRPFIIGVTNTEGSPLAREARLALFTHSGEETGVSCKTALTAMAVLHWVGEHLSGGNLRTARSDLEKLAPALDSYLSAWQEHVRSLWPVLEGVEHFFAAGRGRSLAAAGLSGLTLKESAHVHSEGMSSSAFRHGPFEMLGPGMFVLVFDGDPVVSPMNRRLWRDVLKTGARAALCGWKRAQGPFALPRVPESVRPILELLPQQMASLVLAGLRGRQPGRFERISKVTTVE